MIRSPSRFARRLRSKRTSATYRRDKITRALRAEHLEDRRLLTGMNDGGGSLTIDVADYAENSLIVRFRDDVETLSRMNRVDVSSPRRTKHAGVFTIDAIERMRCRITLCKVRLRFHDPPDG